MHINKLIHPNFIEYSSIVIPKQNNLLPKKRSEPLSFTPQMRVQAPQNSTREAPGIIHASSNQCPADERHVFSHQPETRPISEEQLVTELKRIYAGLVMVEDKCIEVDGKQTQLAKADPATQTKLKCEQWQALSTLHRTLLHKHHDFLLASQHPSASPAVRKLASEYAMPARMWRHGIHAFLELLRHCLPASLDEIVSFIYLAYSMMALMYETVPAFEETWIECLGDLARYRMAIEDDHSRDREVWAGVAKRWYSKASDNSHTTGRLYHHLAILARPEVLEQLFYYYKSLCVAIPFASTRESILTLFDPVLKSDNGKGQYWLSTVERSFIKAHGILFTNGKIETYDTTAKEFLGLLDSYIERVNRKFMEQGYYIAITNSVAMLQYGSKTNVILQAITPNKESKDPEMEKNLSKYSEPRIFFENAQRLSNATLEIVLKRTGDPNTLPYIHATLVFLLAITRHPSAMSHVQTDFPWELLSVMLNTLLVSCEPGMRAQIERDSFPLQEKDHTRPLPEDFAMRGLLWALSYFQGWLTDEKVDEEEKYHERPSMTPQRKERILWLAYKIAALESPLKYDRDRFSVDTETN